MAQDSSLLLRQATVSHLKADGPLLAIVGTADNVHGERSGAAPAFPFTRYGVAETLPARAQCWDGVRVAFPIHSFSKQPFTDEAHGMNAAVAQALDGAVLALDDGGKAHIAWLGSTVLPDPVESDVFHGISRFEATIA